MFFFLENVWFVLFLFTNIWSRFSRWYLELHMKRDSEIVVTSLWCVLVLHDINRQSGLTLYQCSIMKINQLSFIWALSNDFCFAKSIIFFLIFTAKNAWINIRLRWPYQECANRKNEMKPKFFYTVKMVSQEDSEGNALLQINGWTC